MSFLSLNLKTTNDTAKWRRSKTKLKKWKKAELKDEHEKVDIENI